MGLANLTFQDLPVVNDLASSEHRFAAAKFDRPLYLEFSAFAATGRHFKNLIQVRA
ncbi:hypothetical protein EMIT0P265_180025 [Pseudomonas zeae]